MIALTRAPSPRLAECELVHLEREPIDIDRVRTQHRDYCAALARLGCQVVALPDTPQFPDGVFVEDTAVVLDELAVLTRPGAPSRRPEVESVATELGKHRSLASIEPPGTLDGGDVLVVGSSIFVGQSTRTNATAIAQLRDIVAPHGYRVTAIDVNRCLHLKSAVTHAGGNTLLLNPKFVDPENFAGHDIVEVDPTESFAANLVVVGDTLLCSASWPRSNERLRDRGFELEVVASDEIAKAEGALTCCSVLLRRAGSPMAP